jgi:Protein of unknown function (DUF3237)
MLGNTPAGRRMAAEIVAATVSGRLAGSLAGGGSADWFTITAGGLMVPDVRLATKTSDDTIVLVRYGGRLRFVPGRDSAAIITAVFETGDPRYQWLNAVQAAGKGIMSADLSRVDYEIYELQ